MATQQERYAQGAALEVMVEWRGTVMAVEHLESGRFTVGEGGDFDFADPTIPAGGAWTVADIDDGRVRAIIPPGVRGWTRFGDEVAPIEPSEAFQAVTLEPEARSRIEIGELVVHCARVRRAVIVNLPSGRIMDRDTQRSIGGAALLHAVFVLMAMALPLDAATLSADQFDRDERFVEIVYAPERAMKDPFEALRGQGDEGGAGDDAAPAPDEPPTPNAGGAPTRKIDKKVEQQTRAEARAEARAAAEEAIAALNGEVAAGFNDRGPLSDKAATALNGLFGDENGTGTGLGGMLPDGPGRGPGTGPGKSEGIAGYATCDTCDGPGGSYDRGVAATGKRVPKVPPRVVPLDPKVIGGISKEMIQRVIRRNKNQYRFCYEKALKAKRDLAGKVVVKFTIGPNGRVIAARADEDSVGAGVAECVVGKVRRWQFPTPAGGGIVNVRYPFMFKSSGG